MMDGSRLECVGIPGDGCGGGRVFALQNGILSAHDPMSNENIILLKEIKNPKKISKSGCVITIECENEIIEFDLSLMKVV